MSHLRAWQQEAYTLYLEELAKGAGGSLLWEATPGAGKTTAALQVAKHQLKTKHAEGILIVVPTSHLRTQWAQSAAKLGIQIDSSFNGTRRHISSEFHGIVVTYQQIARQPKWFHAVACRSIVILDEVHHAGDGLTWGNSLRLALQHAKFVLCLSGTAFRSDSNPIPFVKYDKDGMSTPDYVYSYAQAIQDRVCRPTAFFTYGGTVSWSEDDQVLTASFSDSLDKMASARRLRSCLDPESGWVQPMIKDAHEMLLATRKEQADAGGLIVCADQTHARAIAKLVTTVCGEKPLVVLSDDSTATKKIKQFSQSSGMWLVACNMVSEGVDIPRLRIGVYATTIRTKMYFRQFLGRIVRRQSIVKGKQVAYCYLPADPFLHLMAEEIENETRHALHKKGDDIWGDEEREERKKDAEVKEKSWTPLSSINSGVDSVIMNGTQLSLFGNMGSTASEEVRTVIDAQASSLFEQTKSEVKLDLATKIKKLVGAVYRKTNTPHSVIHSTLNRAQSVKSQTYCTEAQLVERIQLLEKMMSQESKAGVRARAA